MYSFWRVCHSQKVLNDQSSTQPADGINLSSVVHQLTLVHLMQVTRGLTDMDTREELLN